MSLMFTSHAVRSTTLPQGLWIIFSSWVMISGRRRRHWVFQIDFWCFEVHKPSAIKLYYIQDKADISRWTCSTTGRRKNMYFPFWGELVTRCLWELWSLFVLSVCVLKAPTSHLCKLHMGPGASWDVYENRALAYHPAHTHQSEERSRNQWKHAWNIYNFLLLLYLKSHGVGKSKEDSQGKWSLIGSVAP